ncbi:MAG: hypothetical protein KBS64_06120 [Treponema sp.]|nr:hypothetical protein [Candidatus Treponema equi]
MDFKVMCRGGAAAIAFSIFSFFSCSSTPKAQPQESGADVDVSSQSAVTVTPKKKEISSTIKKEDYDAIETGSPQSLKSAYNSLHKSVDSDYSNEERSMVFVICSIMDMAWPSESGNYVPPVIKIPDQYTGAIESARRGIYDLSTGGSDFLSAVLPSLALLSSNNMEEYYKLSEESLSKALEMRPDSVLANYLMGILCLKTERPQDALKYLNTANGKFSSGTREILFAISEACFKTDNAELALTIGEQLLMTNPQDTAVLNLCSKASYALGDFDKTESYIVRLLLLEPDNTDYVLFRAHILMQKQDFIRASSLLDVCARKNQTNKEYYLLRTRLQCDWNKNYTAAAETISKACELYPDDLDTMLLAAEISSLTGKPVNGKTAMEIARAALDKDGSNVKAREICILEMFRNREYQQAYAMSSPMVADPKSQKSVLYTHIDICLALRKTTEANNIAGRLYKETPDDEEAQMAYIKVLAATGQVSTASQIIGRLLPDANTKMKSFLYYERSFLQSSEDQVLADLRSSLTANPRNKDSLYRLYQIYYNKKDWRRAQYYLKQVVALDPANSVYVRQNSELDKLLKR